MAINKVIFGNRTLLDLTNDTVEAEYLLEGYKAHNKKGESIVGTAKPGSGGDLSYVVALSTTALRNCQIDVLDSSGNVIETTKFKDNGKAQVSLPSTGTYTFRVTYTAAVNVSSNRTILNKTLTTTDSSGNTADTTSFNSSGIAGTNVDETGSYSFSTTY